MFLFFIDSFFSPKLYRVSTERKQTTLTKQLCFSGVQWERLSQISQLGLCRLALIGTLFGEKE